MSRIIISLSGTARCGKDTVADFLARKYNFQKITWAKPLKLFCYTYYNLIPERIEEIKDLNVGEEAFRPLAHEPVFVYAEAVLGRSLTAKEKTKVVGQLKNAKLKSFREALLFFGTEVFRGLDSEFWIKALPKLYLGHEKEDFGNIVFTDTRFPNELNYAKSLNGHDVFVLKNSNFKVNHVSEEFRSEQFSYVIDNNSTLEDLERRVDELLNTLIQTDLMPNTRA